MHLSKNIHNLLLISYLCLIQASFLLAESPPELEKQWYQAIQVMRCSGNVRLISPYRTSGNCNELEALFDREKIHSGEKSSFSYRPSGRISIEVGEDSIIEVLAPANGAKDDMSLFLIQGRVRLRQEQGKTLVKTPNAELIVGKGYADVILSNLNTLAAPRAGEAMEAGSSKARLMIPPGKYGLITHQGDIFISEPATDK